ncbi:MAG TPA: protease modulator HflC [Rhizomicrobium sp.]|nr:protease modulator HflC [Rhizomicrobium sp.]
MSRVSITLATAAALAITVIAYMTFYTINPMEQVIVLQFGAPRAVETEPGLHAKIPWVQTVAYVDKRLLGVEVPSEEVVSQDKKAFVVAAFARWRISDPIRYNRKSPSLDIATHSLTTILDASVRRVLGGQSFAAVLSGERERLMRDIRDDMNAQTMDFGIEIVDVGIRHLDLEDSDAVFTRMREERERAASELHAEGAEVSQLIRARAEREATVIRAEATREADVLRGEGDAEKTRILGEAFGQDPEFAAFYRSMQAYQEALPSTNTTVVLSPSSEFFRYFMQSQGGTAHAAGHERKH